MTAPRSLRRAQWLAEDLILCARGVARAARWSRQSADFVGVGLLEGEAQAVRGRPNSYRIRLVNDSPAAVALTLRVAGTCSSGAAFQATAEESLAPRTAREVFLVTDWRTRFALSQEEPPALGLAAAIAASAGQTCTLVAEVGADGARVETVQPLAG